MSLILLIDWLVCLPQNMKSTNIMIARAINIAKGNLKKKNPVLNPAELEITYDNGEIIHLYYE